MMRKCPWCLQEIPEEAKVCKHCSRTVVKRCRSCQEEIVATAKKCRFCSADLEEKPGAPPPVAPEPVKAYVMRPNSTCGERREIVTSLVLIFLTCGFYGLYLTYKMGDELNRHSGRNDINPGMDLLLTFLTCGIWGFYLMYKYPKTLQDLIQEEGGPANDLVLPCLLLTFFGLHIVALLILQGELNKHWELHQQSGA
jgi:hypothetical protein